MQNIDHQSSMEQKEAAPVASKKFSKRRTILLSALLAPGAGLAASLLATVLMGILRLAAGIPTPVELFGDYVLKHIDVGTFFRLLVTFGSNSKTYPLGLALLGMILVGTVASFLYAALVRLPLPVRGYRPSRREWLVVLAFTVVMTVVGAVLFRDELRQNFYGLTIGWSTFVTVLGLLADFALYGVTLCLAYRALLPKQVVAGQDSTVQARRLLLSRAGVAALSVGSAGATIGLIRSYLNNYASYDGQKTYPRQNVTSPITPNDEHYTVTQNTVDPTPQPALWRLEVTGLVKTPGSYTYEEVQRLPSTSRPIYSVDGYNVSLPLAEVLAVDALLAWRMNGAELPQKHGFPMRVLIPGRYGEENPKWLTRVELTNHFVGGLYSDQGWYNGPLHTISRIDRPRGHVPFAKDIEIGGIAFAGNRGIQRVEISTDGGNTWHDATLQAPLSQDAWRLWTWQWSPSQPGTYTLVSRATDGTGEVQTSHEQFTVPNGATGYHKVQVQVVAS
jgi:DMSO/TMAO reductase YedYZ molybdopterin-dependent catalytic subunit